MSRALVIPVPADDDAAVGLAASSLVRLGRDWDAHVAMYGVGADQVPAAWRGAAADGFADQYAVASAELNRVGQAHVVVADCVTRYHQAVLGANAASTQARVQAQLALDDYRRTAGVAIRVLESRLRELVDELQQDLLNAENDLANVDVIGLIGDGIGGAQHLADAATTGIELTGTILARLGGWQPPFAEATLQPHPASPPPEPWSAAAIGSELEQLDGFLLSSVLGGFEPLLSFDDDTLTGAVNLARRAEETLTDDLTTAQRRAAAQLGELAADGDRLAAVLEAAGAELLGGTSDLLLGPSQVTATAGAAGLIVVEAPLRVTLNALDLTPRMRGWREASQEAQRAFSADGGLERRTNSYRMLAEHTYGDIAAADPPDVSPPGWHVLTAADGPSGAHAVTYQSAEGDVVVSFRGSRGLEPTPGSAQDWAQNIQNAAGLPTPQAEWAIEQISSANRQYGLARVTLVGHSYGGELAAVASIAHGNDAYTYNAEGVGEGNYLLALTHGGHGESERQITDFVASADLQHPSDTLTAGEDATGFALAAGRRVYVRSKIADPTDPRSHELSQMVWPRVDGIDATPDEIDGWWRQHDHH